MTPYEQIASIDAQITALQEQRASILQEWADEHCPFKVGDVVEYLTFRKKKAKMLVTAITARPWRMQDLLWRVAGRVLKKDDTPGARGDSFLQFEYEENPDLFRRIETAEQA